MKTLIALGRIAKLVSEIGKIWTEAYTNWQRRRDEATRKKVLVGEADPTEFTRDLLDDD